MNIDKNLLTNDLRKLRSYVENGRKDDVKYEYARLYWFNETCIDLFDIGYEDVDLTEQDYEMIRLFEKKEKRKLLEFIKNNIEVLHGIDNFVKRLDANGFDALDWCNLKKFDEKEIKDIMLSYYSTFGNKTYLIAKKHFDEKRTSLNHGNNYQGYYIYSTNIQDGYIFLNDGQTDTSVVADLAHELGHAYDFNTFIIPQSKKYSNIRDPYLEVPSTFFEIDFLNYLISQNIDRKGARTLKNSRVYQLVTDDDFEFSDYSKELRENLIYKLGYYFAFHLCETCENKEKFLKQFNNFLTSRCEADIEALLSFVGIEYDEFLSGDIIMHPLLSNNKILSKNLNY